jgi:pimeloyl-ACP methyl ester carboxylesterase
VNNNERPLFSRRLAYISARPQTAVFEAAPFAENLGAPEFLFFHGAGNASIGRVSRIVIGLARVGYRAVAFDAFGHGASGGAFANQSLETRTEQAAAVIDNLCRAPTVLVGFSMGCQVLSNLLPRYGKQVVAAALCAPAAYAADAHTARFDGSFSKIIREHQSWRRSSAFHNVGNFSGPVLLCLPEHDEVIPAEVTDLYRRAVFDRDCGAIMSIAGAPHQLGSWFTDHEDARAKLIGALVALAENARDLAREQRL